MVADWRGLLTSVIPEEELRDLREHGRTGYPLGCATFVERLERTVGRRLRVWKTRPSIEITQTTIIGSCPRNPRLWSVWSERSVAGSVLEDQAVLRSYSNDHNRFVSPESESGNRPKSVGAMRRVTAQVCP
jgi:hypothetical protein